MKKITHVLEHAMHLNLAPIGLGLLNMKANFIESHLSATLILIALVDSSLAFSMLSSTLRRALLIFI